MDLKITSSGDFIINEYGDIALTGTSLSPFKNAEDDAVLAAQMAYMALKTELQDFTLHSYLGNETYKLLGLPNKKETAQYGEKLILEALKNWKVPGKITVSGYPISQQKIRFEVRIEIGTPEKAITITIDKLLNEIGE